jgi:hypothetical protein
LTSWAKNRYNVQVEKIKQKHPLLALENVSLGWIENV